MGERSRNILPLLVCPFRSQCVQVCWTLRMRFARRAFLRAAVFLWKVEVFAARSTRPCTTLWYLAVASTLPTEAASTAFLVKVRIMLLRDRFASRRRSDCLCCFIADAFLAIILLVFRLVTVCSHAQEWPLASGQCLNASTQRSALATIRDPQPSFASVLSFSCGSDFGSKRYRLQIPMMQQGRCVFQNDATAAFPERVAHGLVKGTPNPPVTGGPPLR